MLNDKHTEAKMHEYFEKWVPGEGKADNLAGEIIRATNRILYRWWNDGDQVNEGYGKETCNAAARFLIQKGNKEVSAIAADLFNYMYEPNYEACLQNLANAVVKMIENDPELEKKDAEDFWDYYDADEDEEKYDEDEDWY